VPVGAVVLGELGTVVVEVEVEVGDVDDVVEAGEVDDVVVEPTSAAATGGAPDPIEPPSTAATTTRAAIAARRGARCRLVVHIMSATSTMSAVSSTEPRGSVLGRGVTLLERKPLDHGFRRVRSRCYSMPTASSGSMRTSGSA